MQKLPQLLCVILLLVIGASAQSQATTGNIEGRVVDQNGAAVPNVTVKATNQDTGFGKSAQSSADGNFILPLLPPGNYKVVTSPIQGFAASTYENVKVTVGAKTRLKSTYRQAVRSTWLT